MSKKDIGLVKEKQEFISFHASGLGRMRSTGEIILLMLSFEEVHSRPGILSDVAKKLGISLKEFTDEYLDEICSKCGVAVSSHNYNGGKCF